MLDLVDASFAAEILVLGVFSFLLSVGSIRVSLKLFLYTILCLTVRIKTVMINEYEYHSFISIILSSRHLCFVIIESVKNVGSQDCQNRESNASNLKQLQA
jgi:hypothetical protein